MSDHEKDPDTARPARSEKRATLDTQSMHKIVLALACAVIILLARDFSRPSVEGAPVTHKQFYSSYYSLRRDLDTFERALELFPREVSNRFANHTADTRTAFQQLALRMEAHENATRALQQSSFNVRLDEGQTHAMRAFLTAMGDTFDFPNGGKAPVQPHVFVRSAGEREANKTAFRWEPVGSPPDEEQPVE